MLFWWNEKQISKQIDAKEMNKQTSEIKSMNDWLLNKKLMIFECFESDVLINNDVLTNDEILIDVLSHIVIDWQL